MSNAAQATLVEIEGRESSGTAAELPHWGRGVVY